MKKSSSVRLKYLDKAANVLMEILTLLVSIRAICIPVSLYTSSCVKPFSSLNSFKNETIWLINSWSFSCCEPTLQMHKNVRWIIMTNMSLFVYLHQKKLVNSYQKQQNVRNTRLRAVKGALCCSFWLVSHFFLVRSWDVKNLQDSKWRLVVNRNSKNKYYE